VTVESLNERTRILARWAFGGAILLNVLAFLLSQSLGTGLSPLQGVLVNLFLDNS